MAKQKLEKVLEYLINKEEDKAKALLHQIFVEKARDIHESLMQEDDLDMSEVAEDKDELDDEELAFEEYFSEDDLLGDEGDEEPVDGNEGDDAADDLADDMMGDEGDEAGDDMMSGDEDEGAAEGTGEEDELDLIHDLQDKVDELQAEFDALKNGESSDAEDDAEDDMTADDKGDEEEEVEKADESASIYGESEEDVFEELDRLLGEDFDDLTEAAVDDLEKVSVQMSNAEVGKGGKVNQNNTSPIPQKPKDQRMKATPVEVKSSQHSGFDREAAPSKKDGVGAKSPKNVVGKSTDGHSKMNKSGDANAMLNSSKGFGDGNSKSPLGGNK